jgi:predicted MFS family arabinose efflux permease
VTTCETPARIEASEPARPAVAPRFPLPALLVLSGTAALTLLTELLPAGVLPQMSASLHTSEAQIGFLATAFAIASTLAAIPFASLTRRLPRRPLLIGLLAGLAVANVVTAISSQYLVTFGVRVLAGMANGMLWAMLASYAARLVSAEQRGRAVAITLAGITVTLSAGVPAATALAGWIGWRATFGVVAAVAGALALGVRRQVPPVAGEPPGAARRVGVRRVARLPGVAIVLVVNGLVVVAHQALYTYIAPLAHRSGIASTGLVLLVFGVAAVLGIWITGVLVDRHLRPSVLGSVALMGLAMFALALFGRHPVPLLVAVASWGFAFGGVPTLLQTALIDASGSRDAEVASAIQATIYNAAIAVGSLVGGLVLDGAGAGTLPWTSLPLALVALIVVAGARRHGFPARRATS